MKVIQVGVCPPPYGGVSVHIERLFDFLNRESQDTLLIDTSRVPKSQPGLIHMRWIKAIGFLLFRAPASIVHFHNFSITNTFFYFLISFRHRTIVSFHNERFLTELGSRGKFWQALAVWFLRKVDMVVVDSQHCKNLAATILHHRDRLVIIPEFIPPIDIPPVDSENLLALRRKWACLLASNAFQIAFHQGQDLYGLDLLVELLHRLVNQHHVNAGMVFLLPNIGDAEYFAEINRRIHSYGLADHFCFLTEPVENSVSIWQMSDIVIRATNTDGNSLTIMEALSVKVPVVASDCVERPEGVVLFQNRNVDDLCNQVMRVFANLDAYRSRLENLHLGDHARAFLDLYRTMGLSTNQRGAGSSPEREVNSAHG